MIFCIKYCLIAIVSIVSLENVLLDVRELGKGMELIRRECSLHDHSVLKGFIQASDAQLDKLQKDAKTAEVSKLLKTVHTSLPSKNTLKKVKMSDMRQKHNLSCSSLICNKEQ